MSVDVNAVIEKLSDEQLAKIAATCDENTDAKQLAEDISAEGVSITEEEAEALIAKLLANDGEMKHKLADADVENLAGGSRAAYGRNCWY